MWKFHGCELLHTSGATPTQLHYSIGLLDLRKKYVKGFHSAYFCFLSVYVMLCSVMNHDFTTNHFIVDSCVVSIVGFFYPF